MTGNSCYKITVAVNTPPVIYLRMLSDLTRILRVNRRNIPTPPVETCHSYYDAELRPDVKEEKKREREEGRDQEEAQRSQKREDPFCEGNTPYPPSVDWNPISIVNFTTCLYRRPLTNKSLFPPRSGLSSRFIQIGARRRELWFFLLDGTKEGIRLDGVVFRST